MDLIPWDYKSSVCAKFDCDAGREGPLRASGKSTSIVSTLKLSQAAFITHTAPASLSASASVPHAYPSHGTINQQTQAATTTHSAAILSLYVPYTRPVPRPPPGFKLLCARSVIGFYQRISQQHKYNILHNIQVLVRMWLNSHCSCLNPLILLRLHKILHYSTPCVYYPGTPCLHARDMTLKFGTVYWK